METKQDNSKFFREHVLGKTVRVELLDGRKIYGKFSCVDQQKNIVLLEGVEEIDPIYVPKISESLEIHYRKDNYFLKLFEVPEEVKKDVIFLEKLLAHWMKNKFYTGEVIVPGKHLKKIELAISPIIEATE